MNRRSTLPGPPPAQAPVEHLTRDRILAVAERLFAERGFDAVSIRDITGAAGANLGAINYHFGTKERLIVKVLERRLAPVNEQRLRALQAIEEAAGGRAPQLEAVLEAVIRPVVEQAMDTRRGGPVFSKLMARFLADPNPAVECAMRGHFEPVVKRFDAALLRAMPSLTSDDIFWRMHLVIGALHQSLLMLERPFVDGRAIRLDLETYVRGFVAFTAAGFRSRLPAVSSKRSPAR